MKTIRHLIDLKQGISRLQISNFLKKILLHQSALHGICSLRHYTFCIAISHTVSHMLQLMEVEKFGMQHVTFYLFSRGIEKLSSLEISNFWPTLPLFVHVRFTCTHPRKYVHFTELHPCLKKVWWFLWIFGWKMEEWKEKRSKFL